MNAIKYASKLVHLNEDIIWKRLYLFNYYPPIDSSNYSIYFQRTKNEKNPWISLFQTSPIFKVLEKNFLQQDIGSNSKYWINWTHKKFDGKGDLRYKIYVSPKPNAINETFESTISVCCRLSIPAFKIVSNLNDIYRPDKLVLYFSNLDDIWPATYELRNSFEGIEAHGVPFTFPLDKTGLLSWGIDPFKSMFEFQERESWRIYVSKTIARALKISSLNSYSFSINRIFQRIRFSGIEPNHWNNIL